MKSPISFLKTLLPQASYQQEAAGYPGSNSHITYVNELWQITHPVGWEADHLPSDTEDVETIRLSSAPEEQLQLSVARFQGHALRFDLPPWSRANLEAARSVNESFKLLIWENVQVGGLPAYEATYHTLEGTAYQVSIELHILAGADAYLLRCQTPLQMWDRKEQVLRHLVYSFRPSVN